MRFLRLAAMLGLGFVSALTAQTFSIDNYQLISSQRVTVTKYNVTYSASLINTGGAQPAVSATLTSLDPSVTVVPGKDTLNFAPVPANSQVASSNTFTILVDRSVPFSFSKIKWTFTSSPAPPIANAGPGQTAPVGATVTLDGSGSSNPSGMGVLSYSWAFTSRPAGSNAMLINATSVMPTFVIDVAGTYTVALTVSNGTASSTAHVTISTSNTPPVANAGPNQTVTVGTTVMLNGGGSSDVDGNPLTYSFVLTSRPVGSVASLTGANTISPTFMVDKPGTYMVQLIVNDGQANSNPSTVTITTRNSPPVANAGPGQVVSIGALVQLNGSGSTDVDGDPLTYMWSLTTVPQNSTATLSNPTAVNPTFTADKPGTYIAQLIVNDGQASSAPSTVTITTNQPLKPTANAGPPQTVAANSVVTLNGSGADPQSLPLTYQFVLNSKPLNSTAALTNANTQHPTFIADLPGSYVAQLIVSNGILFSDPSTVTITTTAGQPTANAGPNQTVAAGSTVTLNGSGSTDPSNLPLSYAFSLLSRPAGSNATLTGATTVSPTFIADVPGTYIAQLIVDNGFAAKSNPSTVTITATAGAPSTIAATGGTPQSACLNTAFAAPLLATVKDANGFGVSGVTVTFTAPASGASGSFAGGVNTAVTNASGVATSAVFSSNSITGPFTVTASAPGLATASFSLTTTSCGVLQITPTGGTPQSTPIMTPFASPLQATVKDSGGNPVSGVTVTFTVPAPGTVPSGTFAGGVNTATAVTNAAGVATSAILTANNTAGNFMASATAPGAASSASFILNNTTGGNGSLTASGGTPQTAQINNAFGSSLIVILKDTGGNPLPGVTVTFTAPGTGASGTFAGGVNTAVTNNAGIAASPIFTANATAGSYNVTASVPGGLSATFSLTNSPGPAFAITATGGTPQTAQISTAFSSPLQATVKDSGGNLLSGVTVTFTAPSTGASGMFAGGVNTAVTNASGIATSAVFTANNSAGGPYNVAASVAGVGTNANFALTNTQGPPGTITATGGTPQSAQINAAFASPLMATVKDSGGNVVGGVTVTFSAPGAGAGGSFAGGAATATAVTTSAGVATSPVFTANSTVGPYTVTATVPGLSASFALTNTQGPAASIAATGGTPQSAAVMQAFATALQATVKDAGGNPVSGVTVTFTAPASGASGTFPSGNTAVTNASGTASVAFMANSTVGGPYNVTASTPLAGSTTFALTNTQGPAASIAATGGTPQSAVVMQAFATALQATVKDAGGNPVSGVTVTFTAPGSGASGTFPSGNTAVTNASGTASVAFMANSTVGGPYNVTASAPLAGSTTFSLTNTQGPASQIAATGGTPQSAAISTPFATALQATVKDAGGNPVSGVTVTFTAPASGASGTFPSGNTAVTNASGNASVAFTANSTVGAYNVTASAPLAGSTTFALTNVQGPPASITATGGTPQSAAVMQAFATALQATVKDAGGNPVSGVTVTFTAPASGASGTFPSGNTAVTNASGNASVAFMANSTVGGPYNVTASAPLAGSTTFSLTNTQGPASQIAATGGTPQSAAISMPFATALQATVKDAGGNPVSGVTVTFTAPASGASGTFPSGNTAVTNASGNASVAFTANSTVGGPYNVTASAPLAGSTTFSLTNTQGPAASIAATGGTPQSAAVMQAFATALQATVKDAGGNPVSGVTVTFTAPASGASGTFPSGNTAVTNASGNASVAFTANGTVGGPYNVTASAPLAGSATFSLTNTQGPPSQIAATAGTPQSAPIGTTFATALQVTVKDAGNNPVSGVTVTFTAPASGAGGTFPSGNTAVTNASGNASVAFMANNTIGAYNVTASAPGAGSTTFALTNTTGPAASVTATGGTPQSAAVNSAFAAALQATVKDAGGNPVSGVTVTFVAPGSGASGTFPTGNTAVTNASGVASVAFTANATPGTYNVTGSVAGVAPPATFTLTNTMPAPIIQAFNGTPQSAEVNTAFSSLLVAKVTDSVGNPLSGVTVTFTVPGSGPSGSIISATGNNTAITDANGVASVEVRANGTAGDFTVNASVPGAAPAGFFLTNTAAATGAQIVLTNAAVGKDLQIPYTINLPTIAPSGGVSVTVTSGDYTQLLVAGRASDPGRVSVTVQVQAGLSSTSIFLQGIGSNGSVPLYATAPNFATGTATISVTPSGFVLAGPNGIGTSFTTSQGATTQLTVSAARLDATLHYAETQALRAGVVASVDVISADTNIGTISVAPPMSLPLIFATDNDQTHSSSTASVNFIAGNSGSTTVTVPVPTGFSAPAVGGNSVQVTVNASGVAVTSTSVGNQLETTTNVTLTGAAPSDGLTVHLVSSDPSKLLLRLATDGAGSPAIDVKIPAGQNHSQDFLVEGLASSGSVTITATATRNDPPNATFGTGTGTIGLTPSAIVIAGPFGIGVNNFTTTTQSPATVFNIYSVQLTPGGAVSQIQEIRIDGSATVNVKSSNTAVGTISDSPLTISGGGFTASTQFNPLSAGTTNVFVDVPTGFSTPPPADQSIAVTVKQPGIGVTTQVPIGKNLEINGLVTIGQAAPAGGIDVTLTSADPSLLLFSLTATAAGTNQLVVHIPAGSTNAPYYLQAFGSTGSVTYTAKSNGFADGTGTVLLSPSGVVISGPFGIGFSSTYQTKVSSGPTALLVSSARLSASGVYQEAQQVAGGLSLTASLSSNAPSVGTVSPLSVTITGGGSGFASAQFNPVSASNTVVGISVLPPSGQGYTIASGQYGTVNFKVNP